MSVAKTLPIGFLLRLSIRLFGTEWFAILWELYHHDLDELEIQFLRLYSKRDNDVRTELKRSHDSDTAITSLNNSCFVRSLFQRRGEIFLAQADRYEIKKLEGMLIEKFQGLSEDSLDFSDFCGKLDFTFLV